VRTRNAEGEGGGGGRLHTIHPLRRWLISSAGTAVSYMCYSSVSILLSTNPCDMYKSTLRHIHDPVLLSQDRNNTFTFILTKVRMNISQKLKRYKISEFSAVRTPGDSMNSKRRINVKL